MCYAPQKSDINQCLTHLLDLLKIYKILCISEPTNSLHFRWSSKVAQGNEVLAQQISDLKTQTYKIVFFFFCIQQR